MTISGNRIGSRPATEILGCLCNGGRSGWKLPEAAAAGQTRPEGSPYLWADEEERQAGRPGLTESGTRQCVVYMVKASVLL